MAKNRINVVVATDTHRAFRKLCDKHGMSNDDLLRSLMRNWVDQSPEQTMGSISSRDEIVALVGSGGSK